MSQWRKITVNGEAWKWAVGSVWAAAVRFEPSYEKRLISLDKLTGLSWNSIERGRWKGWFSVTPKHIAAWLSGELGEHGDQIRTRRRVRSTAERKV